MSHYGTAWQLRNIFYRFVHLQNCFGFNRILCVVKRKLGFVSEQKIILVYIDEIFEKNRFVSVIASDYGV